MTNGQQIRCIARYGIVSMLMLASVGCSHPSKQPLRHTYAQMEPLFDNLYFQSKTPLEQADFVRKVDELSAPDFTKTIDDLTAVNAADRLTGSKGCSR